MLILLLLSIKTVHQIVNFRNSLIVPKSGGVARGQISLQKRRNSQLAHLFG
jgi:hypothetical protein